MKKILPIFITIALSGCMSSGVIQTGKDSYMATGNSTPFTIDTSGGGATANAIKLGTKQCNSMGKQFVLQNTSTRQIGAGAQANINFICVEQTDSDYVRPNITPVPQQAPTVVINNRN